MGLCILSQGSQTGALNNLEGWDGVGDRREVQKGGDIRITMGDSC